MPVGARMDKGLAGRCIVARADRSTVEPMVRKHYLGVWPSVVPLIVGLWCDNSPVGVVIFAYPPRETFTRYGGLVWELARLWVDDVMPKNTETWFLSRAVKLARRVEPRLVGLVSYADPSVGHRGYVYRAANWVSDGETDEGRHAARCDYEANGVRYSRRSHVPPGVDVVRVGRVRKARYFLSFPSQTRRDMLPPIPFVSRDGYRSLSLFTTKEDDQPRAALAMGAG